MPTANPADKRPAKIRRNRTERLPVALYWPLQAVRLEADATVAMSRLGGQMKAIALGFLTVVVSAGTASAQSAPTFYKDVLPTLQENCQTCHRPGEVAPMSLISYDDARPWARAIKTKTTAKQMPPWFADPDYGLFANERKLTAKEIDTLAAWADAGAPAGNAKDAPPARRFENGWNIKPDVIVEMP